MNNHSVVKTVPLHCYTNKKTFIVENIQSEEYFEMPGVCIEAIELLNQGKFLQEIQVQLENTYHNEDVDIYDFVTQLCDLNLISIIDGQQFNVEEENTKSKKSLINDIPSSIGKIFFNSISYLIYGTILLANIYLLFKSPELIPTYKDFFVFDSMVFNVLSMMLVSIFFAMLHEFGHIIAARSFDIPTNLGVSNRLFLIVSEADMTHAWKLSKAKRNILYLGGLCVDNLFLFLALISQIYWTGPLIVEAFFALIVFDISIKIIYQFCIYMKTDFYYVIENSTGCHNLIENCNYYLLRKIPFINSGKANDIFKGEERIVRWYSLFYFCGVLVTLLVFLGFIIPQIIFSLTLTVPNLFLSFSDPMFWDALLFVMQIVLWSVLIVFSLYKKYVLR
ncbi:hypothetical protein ABFG93_07790 [Pseudalkalibacillus hwajinpoensis]|uniref:hypothetical protein n=1 Tax=Guptibacillus hwajinpoensis TaxID=208199 RepID=UPI00325B1BAE